MVISYPIDAAHILRKQKGLLGTLRAIPPALTKRIAILGGSSTDTLRDLLELFLLDIGITPQFYSSVYGRYYEEAAFENPALQAFTPDIVYLHTTRHNLLPLPNASDTPQIIANKRAEQEAYFTTIWDSLTKRYNCAIIQNTFEMPALRPIGNLDAVDFRGVVYWTEQWNRWLKEQATAWPSLVLHDLHYLAADFGLQRWCDAQAWHLYKYAMSPEAMVHVAHSLAALIGAMFGKSRKCIVLDADNTLWGGVIGDEGAGHIRIGPGQPEAEAFTAFQRYLKQMAERGVLLAICSKNEPESITEGLNHPQSVLRADDFAAIVANWNPKPDNMREISHMLNIGLDSLVFIDDNPVERALMQQALPEVAVPDIGTDPSGFAQTLDRCRFFDITALSEADIARGRQYRDNAERSAHVAQFADYDGFLASLAMRADISAFTAATLERVTQLINKTNQFNLTTRRLTLQAVTAMSDNPGYITLSGTLLDKFGDNGLISALIGRREGDELHIDIWVMSCRVLKRQMEQAMCDMLVKAAIKRGVTHIIGHYVPTAKNALAKDVYAELGFTLEKETAEGERAYRLALDAYQPQNRFITVNNDD